MKLVEDYKDASLAERRFIVSELLTAAACSLNPERFRDLYTARRAVEDFIGEDALASPFVGDLKSGEMDQRDYLRFFDPTHPEVALAFTIAAKTLYAGAVVFPHSIEELTDPKNQVSVLNRFPDITQADIDRVLALALALH